MGAPALSRAVSTTAAVVLTAIIVAAIVAAAVYVAVPKPAATTVTVTTTVSSVTTAVKTVTLTVTATATPSPPTTTTATTPRTTTTTTPPPPPAKGKVVIGTTDKVTDLDPSNAYDFFTWEVLSNIMEGLVKYKPGTTDIVPALAEKWDVKEGGKVWIFHLRKGLKFADGTPLTAKDVERSVKRVMKINGDPAWLVTEFVEDVEAVDDYTVKFTLKKPVSYFLSLLATPPYFPVHPAYKPDEIDSDQTAGGAGPYKIVKWIRDQVLILEANPNYYGTPARTKTVIIKFYKDATTMRLAIESGEIDIAWRTLRPIDIEDIKKKGALQIIEVPGAFIRYMILNTKMSPTDNVLVRRAIAAAVNREEICKRVFMGTTEPLFSLVPMGMWSHEDVFKEKYGDGNVELAKKLLKEAGFSESNKAKIELWFTPTHYGDTEKDLAQVIKEQLEETGMIEVTIKSAEWSTYVDYARKSMMMISLFGWYPDYIDPDDYTTPFLHSEANKWTGSGYSNPKVDELLDKAALEVVQSKRAEFYKQVQEILAEDSPVIPLIQGKLFIVAKPGIAGIVMDPTMLFRYYLIYWKS